MFKNIVIIGLLLLLSACSSLDRFTQEEQSSTSYSSSESGKFANVTEGKIVSIRQVKLAGSKVLGAAIGSALGGVAGASTTDKKYNQEAATIVGVLAGAALGSTIEKFATEGTGYEFLIKTELGLKAFVDKTKQNLKVGDEVYITKSNGYIRINKK